MSKPNILIITLHDLGDYLPCYGTPVPAPNLDKVAKEGVVFQNHFSTGTVCSPARGSIMTGCYPHTHGLMGLVHRGWELAVDKCPTIPMILREEGYQTHLFGFQHEHWDPKQLGYDNLHQDRPSHCEQITPVLTEWLKSEESKKQPFFVSMGFSETHRLGMHPSGFKRDAYEPEDPKKVKVRGYLPDIPEIREDLADFYGAIKLVDKMVGSVMQTLQQEGLADNTLLIFTTDHGASFLHSKATVYDGGIKVSLLLRWPAGLPQGQQCSSLTSHVDILPSLLDFVGVKAPEGVEGKSFAALAKGETENHRNYIFAEKNYTNYYDPTRIIRSQEFKYIRKGLRTCIFDFVIPELELCRGGFRTDKRVFDFYSSVRCQEELYNLQTDPDEMHNVIADPTYAQTFQELRRALDEHLEVTQDPFRNLRNDLLMPEEGYPRVKGKK